MLRITRTTDYGVLLMTRIAAAPSIDVHNAREMAEESGLPAPMVSKTLKILARAGLLESHRGVKGGYGLARPAETVTVAEIISALEGPIALTDCAVDEPSGCTIESLCPTRGNWRRISRAVREALEGITLAEMTQPTGDDNLATPEPTLVGSSVIANAEKNTIEE